MRKSLLPDGRTHRLSPGPRGQPHSLDHGGGGAGGGGPSTGTVIGGRPGIWTTVWPISGGIPGIPGIPAGGGGGGGGMPLEIWIVMIEPGTVCPAGEVPTTAPVGAVLLTDVASLATWKPASRSRWRAVLSVRPATLGTFEPGAPST